MSNGLSAVMEQSIAVMKAARWVVIMHLGGVKNLDAAIKELHEEITLMDELAETEEVAA